MRRAVRILEGGGDVSLQIDGPRGPARRAKEGVAILSRITGVPIIPISISAGPCLRYRSWDRTLLPLPFARVTCRFGESLEVAEPSGVEVALQALDDRLNQTTDQLDQRHGQRP